MLCVICWRTICRITDFCRTYRKTNLIYIYIIHFSMLGNFPFQVDKGGREKCFKWQTDGSHEWSNTKWTPQRMSSERSDSTYNELDV